MFCERNVKVELLGPTINLNITQNLLLEKKTDYYY